MKIALTIITLFLSLSVVGQNTLFQFSKGSNCSEQVIYNINSIYVIEETSTGVDLIINGRVSVPVCASFDSLYVVFIKEFLKIKDLRTSRQKLVNKDRITLISPYSNNYASVNILNLDGGEESIRTEESYAELLSRLKPDAENEGDDYIRQLFYVNGTTDEQILLHPPILTKPFEVLLNGKEERVNVDIIGNLIRHKYRNFVSGVLDVRYYY